MALLKIYRFYDAIIKTSVLMTSDGICGIVFRAEDSANFYVFEMKNMGFKRVRRVFKGQSKEDGGGEESN